MYVWLEAVLGNTDSACYSEQCLLFWTVFVHSALGDTGEFGNSQVSTDWLVPITADCQRTIQTAQKWDSKGFAHLWPYQLTLVAVKEAIKREMETKSRGTWKKVRIIDTIM